MKAIAWSMTYNGQHCDNVYTDKDHALVRMRTLNKNYPQDQRALVPLVPAGSFDFEQHLARQRAFSERTFGPGMRTQGVVDHIRKELNEMLAKPTDLSEWIDVTILALDGAWRTGATPEQIIAALVAKQTKNEARTWPDWRTAPADRAIEHVRHESESLDTSEREAVEPLQLEDEHGPLACPAAGMKPDACSDRSQCLEACGPLGQIPLATCTVHLPNGLVHACERHASTARLQAKFLGTHAYVDQAPADTPCTYCAARAAG